MNRVAALLLLLPIQTYAQPYPLCPVSNWEGSDSEKAQPLSVQMLGKSPAPIGEEMLKSAFGKIDGANILARSKTAVREKALDRNLAAVGSAIKQQRSSPGSHALWIEAAESLKALPLEDREKILTKNLPTQGKKFSVADLKGAQLNERIKLTSVTAQLAALNGAVDPRTLDAYLGGKAHSRTPEELLKLHSDPSFKALTLQTLGPGRINITIPKTSLSPLIVGTGEESRPGGLSLVPGQQPVAFGKTAGGAVCLRPADPSDWKLGETTNKIGRVWDPNGFRDVGLFVWRTNDGKGKVGSPNICSFVRIGGEFAVTAAHCVIESRKGAAVRVRNLQRSGIEAVALLPQYNFPDADPLDCFEKPAKCGFHVTWVQTNPQLPDKFAWPSSSDWPVPDVALLTVPFDNKVPAASTGVAAGISADERVTMAGYGTTNAVGYFNWGSLLVGWQRQPPKFDSTGLIWSVNVRKGAAGACGGDSGGAVYSGDIAGAPKELRVLAGVISSGSPSRTGASEADKCANALTGRAARLDNLLPWLCAKSGNSILGCQGNPVVAAN